jgi:hypothetical protein
LLQLTIIISPVCVVENENEGGNVENLFEVDRVLLDELENVLQNLDHLLSQLGDALRLENFLEVVQFQIQNIDVDFQT